MAKIANLMLVFGVAMGLTACSTYLPTQGEPVQPTYTSNSQNLTSNGALNIDVRAFQGRDQELSGVPCTVKSTYYSANVITPGLVTLPSFAEKTPPVVVSCSYNDVTKSSQFNPINLTVENRTAAWGGGLLTYAIVAASTKAENSVFGYGTLSVDFSK